MFHVCFVVMRDKVINNVEKKDCVTRINSPQDKILDNRAIV